MTKTSIGPAGQRSLIILTFTVVSVVTIGVLYWGQTIFIPVTLGAFLTFLLSPLVAALRQRGVPRTPAVFLTVCLAALVLGMVGWVVTGQVSSLLRELPKYSENIKAKAKSLRQIAAGSNRFTKMLVDFNQELRTGSATVGAKETAENEDGTASAVARSERVVVAQQSTAWIERATTLLAPLMEYLSELALAIVLVVFMLQKREELRNRIIRLMGPRQIAAATKFVDEAAQRISRFLLMQAIVNSTFGLTVGLSLLLIGVKYALLWGFLAAMLRYLPYIGAYLAAVLPILLSLAMFDGWGTTLLVVGLFVILELIIANLIEPWLYGPSMGVSEIALLVSAAFWAFLWGPIGLVLSSPLTVCLVMLGRYVPQLEFIAVLLGDRPALDPCVSFYQRLLARDQDEALELIVERSSSADGVYDEMLIPTLRAAKVSRRRGEITEADEKHVLQAIRSIVEDLGQRPENPSDAGEESEGSRRVSDAERTPTIRALGCPAHDATDQAVLEMLRNLLDPVRWNLEVIAAETLTAELLDQVAEDHPALVCLAALPPGGLAHARYLCKRLRARFPELRILVCHWQPKGNARANIERIHEVGGDWIAMTILEASQQLTSQHPVLTQIQRDRDIARRPRHGGAVRTDAQNRVNQGYHATDRDRVTNAPSQ